MRLAAARCSSSPPAATPLATLASTSSRRGPLPASPPPRAAGRLADEPDTPERRAQPAAALAQLPVDDLPAVTAAVESLRADPELAWRSFALSLLADELADE